MSNVWKQTFLEKLGEAQSTWSRRFDETLDSRVLPVYEELKSFLIDNGFSVSIPLREQGRRSFKFQLAENAYLLVIFRTLVVGEFEIRCESFVPGCEPVLKKAVARLTDIDEQWAQDYFESALDTFVSLLSNEGRDAQRKPRPELVAV